MAAAYSNGPLQATTRPRTNARDCHKLMPSNVAMEERDDAQPENGEHGADNQCEYELMREERIRRNNARMQELGVST